jgi:hypothetical protein
MKFVMFVCGDPDHSETDAAAAPSEESWFDAAGGTFRFGAQLHGPDTATTVRVRDGELIVTDGPFVETKEWIAGVAILEAPDLDTAIELAAKNPMAYHGRLEIRPVHSMGGPDWRD